jgi:hypothetical protein
MIAALERAWAAIQDQNPDVPLVVIVLGGGPGLKLRHFAAMRWHAADRDDANGDQDADRVSAGGATEVRLPEVVEAVPNLAGRVVGWLLLHTYHHGGSVRPSRRYATRVPTGRTLTGHVLGGLPVRTRTDVAEHG